mgnify:CR=1 FL=1
MEFKNLISKKQLKMDGPLEIIPSIFEDKRGLFFESWNQNKFDNLFSQNNAFVQDNESHSNKYVLRGMHYQVEPKSQGKLVRVTQGSIYDVIVDLRRKSKTFGLWAGLEINSKLNNQLWVPVGFAHGFIAISDLTIVQYKTTDYWSPEHERCLLWNDREINIDWKNQENNLNEPIISDKDLLGETLDSLIKKGEIFK